MSWIKAWLGLYVGLTPLMMCYELVWCSPTHLPLDDIQIHVSRGTWLLWTCQVFRQKKLFCLFGRLWLLLLSLNPPTSQPSNPPHQMCCEWRAGKLLQLSNQAGSARLVRPNGYCGLFGKPTPLPVVSGCEGGEWGFCLGLNGGRGWVRHWH